MDPLVIFCDKFSTAKELSDKLLFGLCDHVACRTKYNRMVFEIDEKNIVIDIRRSDADKAAGLRPDYVLFYDACYEFVEYWEHHMGGRYKKINSLDELIQMVIS